MSRTLDLPESAHLWQTSEIPTLVLTEGANPEFQQLLLKGSGGGGINIHTG